jgi:hypothetical protein
MGRVLLSFSLPRSPRGCFLLGNADQDHLALAALLSRGAQQWLNDLLFVLALGEVANGIPSA